ncbi:DUF2785 domain-containing protein [Fictibacillus sp. B-59209]|uniref:DUF2785 domain-containing protein n=1 Tax=Fictibacillus sp. B-59209 TaxID=3024873 RepID=UPI002E230FA5|nr:DUF2785 domain-containing protein [Fictibacillus sp. B-59209]
MESVANTAFMNEEELKNKLAELKNGEKSWEEEDKSYIVQSMMEHLGSVDSDLRDELIYDMFCKLIIDNQLEHEVLSGLLTQCLSESYLFKGLGEEGTDTVFKRSFSALVTALILYKDNQESFLSFETVHEGAKGLLKCLKEEKDYRGLVDGKGWAHSIAHIADAVDEVVKNSKCSKEVFPEILDALWGKVLISNYVYIHNEDERIITPILALLENGLTVEEVKTRVEQMPQHLIEQKEQLAEKDYYVLRANSKNFLKSFYVQLADHESLSALQESVLQHLKQI